MGSKRGDRSGSDSDSSSGSDSSRTSSENDKKKLKKQSRKRSVSASSSSSSSSNEATRKRQAKKTRSESDEGSKRKHSKDSDDDKRYKESGVVEEKSHSRDDRKERYDDQLSKRRNFNDRSGEHSRRDHEADDRNVSRQRRYNDRNRDDRRSRERDRYRDDRNGRDRDRYRQDRGRRNEDRRGDDRRRERNDYRRDNRDRRRRSRSGSFDHTNAKWGKDDPNSKDKKTADKEKPNFGLSGKLTEETNTYKGVVIKYSEPPEARKPKRRWRLYPFKGEKALQTLYIHRESAYLIGRDRKVVDLPVDHPSCSKQHAVLQYRLVPFTREDGSAGKRVRPYIIDLESANGTFINNKKIEAKKYVELLEKDVIKFGFSSREYVLLHENSKDEAQDDDVKIEEEEVVKNEATA